MSLFNQFHAAAVGAPAPVQTPLIELPLNNPPGVVRRTPAKMSFDAMPRCLEMDEWFYVPDLGRTIARVIRTSSVPGQDTMRRIETDQHGPFVVKIDAGGGMTVLRGRVSGTSLNGKAVEIRMDP